MAEWDAIVERITDFIKNFIHKAGADGVVVGVSGGIDSACVAKLCTMALGREKVFALVMPEKGVTPEEDVEDALNLCDELGIDRKVIEISPAVSAICKLVGCDGGIPFANIKPRVRMILLYYHANSMNRLVAGTGNRSELLAGYFTKYGDGGVDFLPIGELYKTEVFQLARHLGIPDSIVNKKPSARLWSGQTDEEEMGISYSELDSILMAIEELGLLDRVEKGELTREELEKIAEKSKSELKKVELVVEMVRNSAHKRHIPPCAEIRELLRACEK